MCIKSVLYFRKVPAKKVCFCIHTIPGTFYISIKVPGKSVLCIRTIPGSLNIFKKNCLAKKFLYLRTIPGTICTILGTFNISIKVPGKSVLCIRMFPGTFYIFKKVPGKKCHLLPHLPRHLTFFL